jgi:hypothetical protein
LLFATVACLSAASSALAADRFDVGDRVEVDDLGTGAWRAGVVIAENERTYLVRMDPMNVGGSTVNFTVLKTGIYETRIRASTASLPDAQKTNSSAPTGILDCPIRDGINNRTLSEALLAKLIRCMNEYKNGAGPTSIGTDSRFDITAMTVGKPRSWNVLNDIGAGTASTPVYPVKVSYTQLWWSRESVRTQKGIAVYGCYYSTLSEWVCALNSSVHKEPMLVQPR